MTKLYLIEGLPCSGKSTTSKYVAGALEKQGRSVSYFDEGTGNHPADYEFHAYLDSRTFQSLDSSLQEKISRLGQKKPDGYIVPLQFFSGSEFDTLLKHKIYDFLPWEEEQPIMLARWQEFAHAAVKSDSIFVFNCVFLQNPMCETMMRFDLPEEKTLSHLSKIYETIRPLQPQVIYLKNDHIAASVLRASREREGWLEEVTHYHVTGGYGKRIGAQGFGGYIACLEERQRRELRYLELLGIPALILPNPQLNWEEAYERINSLI